MAEATDRPTDRGNPHKLTTVEITLPREFVPTAILTHDTPGTHDTWTDVLATPVYT